MAMMSAACITDAVDARRRRLPAGLAFMLLTGGLSASLIGQLAALCWTLAMIALLSLDAHIYDRLDRAGTGAHGWRARLLHAAPACIAGVFGVAPALLWGRPEPAASVAAFALWLAAGVALLDERCWPRPLGAIASVALSATLAWPVLVGALFSPDADWSASLIALMAGAALIVFARNSGAASDHKATNFLHLEETKAN